LQKLRAFSMLILALRTSFSREYASAGGAGASMSAAVPIKLACRDSELSITVSNRPIARETTQSRPC
jgi:hypothetical protein